MHARSRPVLLFERLLPGSRRDAGRLSAALPFVVNAARPSTTRWQLSADHHLGRVEAWSFPPLYSITSSARSSREAAFMFANGGTKRAYPDVCPLLAKATSLSHRLAVAMIKVHARAQFSRRYCGRGFRNQSREVKVALVLNQLSDGDVLDRDGVVGIGRDHRVPAAIIMGGRQE